MAEEGHLQVSRNCLAREADEEEAAAVTVCLTSETARVEGSIIRSLPNSASGFNQTLAARVEHGRSSLLSAMPPVAV